MTTLIARVLYAGMFLTSCLGAAELALEIPSERVPPGGMAQIKIFCTGAAAVAAGRLEFALPPELFGPPQAADVFSAMGDALGLAYPLGDKFIIRFTSAAAGGCREAALPLAVLNVPVLPTAPAGRRIRLALHPASELKDAAGNPIPFSVSEGTLEVGGTLSLRGMVDGAWDLPAGAEVVIEGTGFGPGTELDAGGVPSGPVQVLSTERLSFRLLAAAHLRGKRLQVRTPNGALVENFIVPPNGETPARVWPILPNRTQSGAVLNLPNSPGYRSAVFLRNPSQHTVRYELYGDGVAFFDGRVSGELRAGQWAIVNHAINRSFRRVFLTARPLQVAEFNNLNSAVNDYVLSQGPPAERALSALQLFPARSEIRFNAGDTAPVARFFYLPPSGPATGIQWKVEGDAPWLRVISSPVDQEQLQVEIDPRGLAPGLYVAKILVTRSGTAPGEEPPTGNAEIVVRVGPNAELRVSPTAIAAAGVTAGYAQDVQVDGAPGLPFRAAVNQPWLTVTPAEGISPARLTLRVQEGALPVTDNRAELQIACASGLLTVPIAFSKVRQLPDTLRLVARTNTGQRIPLTGLPGGLLPVSSATEDGSNWLKIEPDAAVVTAGGLAAGGYRGTLRLEDPRGNMARTVPVALTVWDQRAPSIPVTPIEVTLPAGEVRDLPLSLYLAGEPLTFSAEPTRGATSNGKDWLSAENDRVRVAPPPTMPAGVYLGVLPVTWSGQTVTIPVRMQVLAANEPPSGLRKDEPSPGFVFDGELTTADAVTPGGTVRIYGDQIGPVQEAFRDLYRVYFDGTEARILEASPSELLVIAPPAVAGKAFTAITVEASGMRKVINMPVRITGNR